MPTACMYDITVFSSGSSMGQRGHLPPATDFNRPKKIWVNKKSYSVSLFYKRMVNTSVYKWILLSCNGRPVRDEWLLRSISSNMKQPIVENSQRTVNISITILRLNDSCIIIDSAFPWWNQAFKFNKSVQFDIFDFERLFWIYMYDWLYIIYIFEFIERE